MTRKTRIRIGIVVVLVGVMCFSDWSFAAGETEQKIFDMQETLHFITSILSRGWVIFANLAGEFLTNKWVYGEIVGLDSLLWKCWVLIRNIANFGLGFYFIYAIFGSLIRKDEDIIKRVKDNLLWILIAGVGIQVSRFFTSAMIDVSTITLVTAGNLPSHIISKDAKTKDDIIKSLAPFMNESFMVTTGREYRLFPTNGNSNSFFESVPISMDQPLPEKNFLDMLVPNADNISGPLYYLGFSILNTDLLSSNNTSSVNAQKAALMNTIIQGGTTVIYAIEMGVLCVLALMRIIYLWMFIVLSPLVMLIRCITKADQKVGDKIGGEKGFLGSLTKHVNFGSFFINIFKPTIIVLGIGIAMIFANLMGGVVNKNVDRSINENLGGVQIISEKDGGAGNGVDGNQTYTTSINSNVFSYTIRHAGKDLMSFIISVITVILVFIIIKAVANLGGGKDFVSEKFGKIQEGIEGAITSFPIVPVAGYDSKTGEAKTRYLSAGKVFGLSGNSSLLQDKIDNYRGKIDTYERDKETIRRELFGNKNTAGALSVAQMRMIDNAMGAATSGRAQLEAAKRNIPKQENGYGMTLNPATALNDNYWIKKFKGWLNDRVSMDDYASIDSKWKKMIDSWKGQGEEGKRSLKDLFQSIEYVQAYVEFFFEEGDERRNITRWDALMNEDISKLPSKKSS